MTVKAHYSFEQFIDMVDSALEELAGISTMELPDFNYYSAYDNGDSAEECAEMVLDENGFGEFKFQ